MFDVGKDRSCKSNIVVAGRVESSRVRGACEDRKRCFTQLSDIQVIETGDHIACRIMLSRVSLFFCVGEHGGPTVKIPSPGLEPEENCVYKDDPTRLFYVASTSLRPGQEISDHHWLYQEHL